MVADVGLLMVNTLSYFLLTCDMLAVSQMKIKTAMSVNAIVAALSFVLMKYVQSNNDFWGGLSAYTAGGVLGVYFGMVLMRKFSKNP